MADVNNRIKNETYSAHIHNKIHLHDNIVALSLRHKPGQHRQNAILQRAIPECEQEGISHAAY